MSILPNSLQRWQCPRFTTDKAAWQWIAEELSKPPTRSAIKQGTDNGLCIVLNWMRNQGMISGRRKDRMSTRLFNRFYPQHDKGEYPDGAFIWIQGVRAPRVMAAQLMALLPIPRHGGR